MQIVQRSNERRLTYLAALGPLPIDEIREAVRNARTEVRRALPWLSRPEAAVWLPRFLPTWPLPPEAVERIEREFQLEPILKVFSPVQAARFACWWLASSIAAFLLVWANQPAVCDVGARVCSGALAGVDARPLVGSFSYLTFYAVTLNTPADVGVRSPAAHLVQVATWLGGLVILGVFGKKLFKRIRLDRLDGESAPSNPRGGQP